jgi:hypothetical protein
MKVAAHASYLIEPVGDVCALRSNLLHPHTIAPDSLDPGDDTLGSR